MTTLNLNLKFYIMRTGREHTHTYMHGGQCSSKAEAKVIMSSAMQNKAEPPQIIHVGLLKKTKDKITHSTCKSDGDLILTKTSKSSKTTSEQR